MNYTWKTKKFESGGAWSELFVGNNKVAQIRAYIDGEYELRMHIDGKAYHEDLTSHSLEDAQKEAMGFITQYYAAHMDELRTMLAHDQYVVSMLA